MINMVISHELKFVFLGIPRTANRAMHRVLLKLPGAFRGGLLHEMGIPEACKSYFTFCCVRNPYRRFLAYYRWRGQNHPWGGDAVGMSFEDYISAMERGDLGPCTVRGHTGQNRLDRIIKYEELPESFTSLPLGDGSLDLELPRCGQRLSRHWKMFFTEHNADRVYELCKTDFEEFGYCRHSWKEE